MVFPRELDDLLQLALNLLSLSLSWLLSVKSHLLSPAPTHIPPSLLRFSLWSPPPSDALVYFSHLLNNCLSAPTLLDCWFHECRGFVCLGCCCLPRERNVAHRKYSVNVYWILKEPERKVFNDPRRWSKVSFYRLSHVLMDSGSSSSLWGPSFFLLVPSGIQLSSPMPWLPPRIPVPSWITRMRSFRSSSLEQSLPQANKLISLTLTLPEF